MLEIHSNVKILNKGFAQEKYIYNLEINNPSFVLCLEPLQSPYQE